MDQALTFQLVSAFPGCGKSTFKEQHQPVYDSDSSQFPKDKFPWNYLAYLRDRVILRDSALISSHKQVREGLSRMGLHFLLVYPVVECKEEYLKRYRDRGSPTFFLDLLSNNWEAWIAECQAHDGPKIALIPGQFLADVIEYDYDARIIRMKQPFSTT